MPLTAGSTLHHIPIETYRQWGMLTEPYHYSVDPVISEHAMKTALRSTVHQGTPAGPRRSLLKHLGTGKESQEKPRRSLLTLFTQHEPETHKVHFADEMSTDIDLAQTAFEEYIEEMSQSRDNSPRVRMKEDIYIQKAVSDARKFSADCVDGPVLTPSSDVDGQSSSDSHTFKGLSRFRSLSIQVKSRASMLYKAANRPSFSSLESNKDRVCFGLLNRKIWTNKEYVLWLVGAFIGNFGFVAFTAHSVSYFIPPLSKIDGPLNCVSQSVSRSVRVSLTPF